jgi:hypothetical protein
MEFVAGNGARGPRVRQRPAGLTGCRPHSTSLEEKMKHLTRRLTLLAIASLVTLAAACDRHPTAAHDDHSLGRVEIIDRGQTDRPVVAAWTPATGWQGALPDISLATPNQRISLGARIFDAHNEERTLSRDGEYSVRWSLAPNAPAGIVVNDDSRGERFHGDHIHLYGQAAGTTQVQFVLWHVDHADGATGPISLSVVN